MTHRLYNLYTKEINTTEKILTSAMHCKGKNDAISTINPKKQIGYKYCVIYPLFSIDKLLYHIKFVKLQL